MGEVRSRRGGGRRERVRDRMAGPENGLFFPIRPNKMLWRMKGGDKPDVSPLLSVENGRCIRIPLPV